LPVADSHRRILGRYELREEIGRGTMGVVYRAFDPDLGRILALKTVQLAFTLEPAEREAYERRFLAEARVAAGLAHPGIVVVHDVGRSPEDGTLFIALEYLEGRTLAAMTAGGQRLPWPEALRVSARVAEALHHAHQRGVIHRDVKPANVMLLGGGEVKLMDFGIAKVPAAQLTSPGEFFGTPLYMSPEQAGGGAVDGRSDVFSLGAVLYMLLTGRRAFDAPTVPAILHRVLHDDPAPASAIADLSPALDAVLARALAKEPARRYATALAFAEDLEDLRAGRAPAHAVAGPPPRERTDPKLAATAREPPTLDMSDGQAASGSEPVRTHTFAIVPGRRRWRPRLALTGAAALFLLLGAGLALWAVRRGPAGGRIASSSAPGTAATPQASPSSGLPWPFAPARPGRLEVDFSHSLRYGVLRVYLDDELQIEEPLEARVTKKVLFYKRRQGAVSGELSVPPGSHTLRVAVESGDERWSRRISGEFKAGEARRLVVSLEGGGLIGGRELELYWAPAGAREARPLG
jgi:serine/threonine-protein kinase